MADALDALFAEVDDARGRPNAVVTLAALVSVDADGLTGTAQGLGSQWTEQVRLWHPKFVEVLPHIHPVDGQATDRVENHAHNTPATETGDSPPHTPTILYEAGDRGLLLHVGGGAPLFLGGLPQ